VDYTIIAMNVDVKYLINMKFGNILCLAVFFTICIWFFVANLVVNLTSGFSATAQVRQVSD